MRSDYYESKCLSSTTKNSLNTESAIDDNDEEESMVVPQPKHHRLWSLGSLRFRVALALALALSVEGLMRSNINMAMVCMVNETALSALTVAFDVVSNDDSFPQSVRSGARLFTETPNGVNLSQVFSPNKFASRNPAPSCVNDATAKLKLRRKNTSGDLVITKSEQAMIFTAFYAGGLAIVMPGSYLCDKLGATNLVLYGALVNVAGSLATPFVARAMGASALTLLRFLMGCGQGVLIPCMSVLITHWFPLAEKSTAIAIATTGNQISVIVAMFLTAELCQFSWLGGWASAFYSYGLAGVAMCALWMLWVTDTPADAEHIEPAELKYIYAGELCAVEQQTKHNNLNKKDVPWRQILTSLVVWSTSLSSFSQNFMIVGTVVYLPSYYRNVLGMNLSSNGMMSALPFIVQLITKIIFTAIADQLRSRKIMSHSSVVKLFNLLASVGSGICFILLSFCDCTQSTLAITLAVSAMGLGSGFIPGYNTSVVCIAPRYTASVASFSRLLGQIASVASPYMIGLIVVKGVREEWQLAFFVMAFLLISTGILFQCCGSASVQEWAKTPLCEGAKIDALERGDDARTRAQQQHVTIASPAPASCDTLRSHAEHTDLLDEDAHMNAADRRQLALRNEQRHVE